MTQGDEDGNGGLGGRAGRPRLPRVHNQSEVDGDGVGVGEASVEDDVVHGAGAGGGGGGRQFWDLVCVFAMAWSFLQGKDFQVHFILVSVFIFVFQV